MGGSSKTLPVVPPASVGIANAVSQARATMPPIATPGATVAAATTAATRVRKLNTGSGRSSYYTPPPAGAGIAIPVPAKPVK
jgi:hypothetical protein